MGRLIPIIGGLLALMLAACSSGGGTEAAGIPTGDGQTQATAPPVPAATLDLPRDQNGNLVVARVNGQPITFGEYERTLDRYRNQGGEFDALLDRVLDTLIEQELIEQAAQQQGITITQTDIDAEYQSHRELVETDVLWNEWLEANGYTDDEFRNEVIPAQLLTTRLRDAVTGIQGEEVNEVRARHILVNTEEEAQEVLVQLATGADFAQLAMQYSEDVTTRENGGDLGWFIREDLFTPELADVAFGLAPGEIEGPVATMLGYHVIQTLELRTRIALEEELALMAEQQFADYLAGLLSTATIERYI